MSHSNHHPTQPWALWWGQPCLPRTAELLPGPHSAHPACRPLCVAGNQAWLQPQMGTKASQHHGALGWTSRLLCVDCAAMLLTGLGACGIHTVQRPPPGQLLLPPHSPWARAGCWGADLKRRVLSKLLSFIIEHQQADLVFLPGCAQGSGRTWAVLASWMHQESSQESTVGKNL